MNDTKLIIELKLYVEWFETTMLIAYSESQNHQEEMLMYIAAKQYLERYN